MAVTRSRPIRQEAFDDVDRLLVQNDKLRDSAGDVLERRVLRPGNGETERGTVLE